jgi:hypothetical protein
VRALTNHGQQTRIKQMARYDDVKPERELCWQSLKPEFQKALAQVGWSASRFLHEMILENIGIEISSKRTDTDPKCRIFITEVDCDVYLYPLRVLEMEEMKANGQLNVPPFSGIVMPSE